MCGHHIARRVGGYRVGRGSDKYLLDTGRGFVLAIETVMYTLHLFRRLCLCIQITAKPGTFFQAVETTPCVISLSFRWVNLSMVMHRTISVFDGRTQD